MARAGARMPAAARQKPGRLPGSVAAAVPGWYARIVTPVPVLGGGLAGPWFRVQSILARRGPASAEHDFLDILPAAAAAARAGRPLVAGWLCRAAGGPLEFITNAALPAPQAGNGCALLFPPGARGAPRGPPRWGPPR